MINPAVTFQFFVASVFAAPDFGAVDPKPAAPDLINEVRINPPGTDASAACLEYIEIYKTTSGNIGGYTLMNHAGIPLFTFPDMYIPAGTKCVVFLRPFGGLPMGMEEIVSNGGVAFSSASLPLGEDYLQNDEGGVQLWDHSYKPKLLDAVYWSATGRAPSFVTSAAAPGFVDISFAGGTPLGYDGTIGRAADPVAAYTGSASDFTIFGGIHAAGPTPGRDNRILHFTPAEWMQESLDETVRFILQYSTGAAPGWLEIVDSSARLVSSSVAQNELQCVARFELKFRDASAGLLTFSGDFSLSAEVAWKRGNATLTTALRGRLLSNGPYGFTISQTESTSGFRLLTQTTIARTSFSMDVAGDSYTSNISEVSTRERLGAPLWRLHSQLSLSDSSGLQSRRSTGTVNITEMSGGLLETVALVERDRPFPAQFPRVLSQSPAPSHWPRLSRESIAQKTKDIERNDDAAFRAEILQLYYKLNDQIVVELDPEARSSVSLGRVSQPDARHVGTEIGAFFQNTFLTLLQSGSPMDKTNTTQKEGTPETLQFSQTIDWASPVESAGRMYTKGIVDSRIGAVPFDMAIFTISNRARSFPFAPPVYSMRVPRVDVETVLSYPSLPPAGSLLPRAAAHHMAPPALQLFERAGAGTIRVVDEIEIEKNLQLER